MRRQIIDAVPILRDLRRRRRQLRATLAEQAIARQIARIERERQPEPEPTGKRAA